MKTPLCWCTKPILWMFLLSSYLNAFVRYNEFAWEHSTFRSWTNFIGRLTEWHSSFTFFIYEEDAHNFHHSVAELYPVSL